MVIFNVLRIWRNILELVISFQGVYPVEKVAKWSKRDAGILYSWLKEERWIGRQRESPRDNVSL